MSGEMVKDNPSSTHLSDSRQVSPKQHFGDFMRMSALITVWKPLTSCAMTTHWLHYLSIVGLDKQMIIHLKFRARGKSLYEMCSLTFCHISNTNMKQSWCWISNTLNLKSKIQHYMMLTCKSAAENASWSILQLSRAFSIHCCKRVAHHSWLD